MKSLLNKTLFKFIGCTIIILILATPVFYLLTKQFYAEDMIDLMEAMERGEKVPHLDMEKDILQGVMIQFFLIFFVLSISMLITLRIITRRLWHPFNDTLKKMEKYNLEQGGEPEFLPTNVSEFNQLNESVKQLITKNRQSYLTQKEFTENASHELQTPLALFQSQLDLLLQENLNEDQYKIVNNMYRASSRMSRLNKNLLLLAKIENSQYGEFVHLNLNNTIERQLPLFEHMCGSDIRIFFRTKADKVVVKANEVLFESLLNNLVVNAIRHSSNQGLINIVLETDKLTVSNVATLGPLDKEKLFRRFQFTDDQKRGNGLGLSIVKAICDYHNWSIDYYFARGCHNFEVNFDKIK